MSQTDARFARLTEFLSLIPAVETDDTPAGGFAVESGAGGWRVAFAIDIDHELAWETVQELAHALNSLPAGDGPVTVFRPTSPAPDQNGGPEEFLSWAIEAADSVAPDAVAELLAARLPSPVEDERSWRGDDDSDDDGDDLDDDSGDEDEDEEIGDGGDY